MWRTRAQDGFTLIEILVATAIGALVMALAFNAYFGANKAKALMGASSMLNDAGQKALNDIYTSLHGNKHLFTRGATADSFLGRLNLAGYDPSPGVPSPGVTSGDLLLPIVDATGAVWALDASNTANPNFNPNDVGNALFFAESLPDAVLGDQNNVLQTTFQTSQYRISVYRLHLYYLARHQYAPGTLGQVKPGANYVYRLMSWVSVPYLDYSDMSKWMNRISDEAASGAIATSTAQAYMDAKLTSLQTAAGATHFTDAIDLTVPDGGLTATPAALHSLTPAAVYRDLSDDTTSRFVCAQLKAATNFDMANQFGVAMVAFDTQDVSVSNLTVPSYASTASATAYPWGLETMIVGPTDARQVLLHLSLAAKTTPGRVLTGVSLQQIVQAFDE